MATLLFSSVPSTPFLLKNPNPSHYSSNFICNGFPISISKRGRLVLRRSSISASVAEFAVAAQTRGAGRAHHLDISKLGISEEIVSSLSKKGITELFPIQRAVLEPAMEGRDMICRAITGSGKTLAFGIPILDKIIQNRSPQRGKRVPTALVLAPTRELARQVQKEFKESAPNLSSACLYGGMPIIHQSRMLSYGIDIAVGTPGRIIDLVERGALDLSEVKFVVLDEADQMLAIGFQEAVECILSYLPAKKQCMLFSATMPSWVNEISRKYLKNPLVIDLVGDSEQKLADGISLYSVPSTASRKQNNLLTLISKYGQGGKSIVFTKTKKDAESLSRSMGSALGSQALHGNMQQFQRDKTIAAFRDGRFNVLVATDVAARGLDIPNVDLVVHFEIPNTSEIFVHRSGRTGRAGKRGTTVLMFTESQRRAVKYIERDLGCKFEELPKITEGVGNITGRMGMEENHYERYGDDQFPRRPIGGYGQSRGQSYGSTNETRGQHSNGFKLRYGDDQSPRRAVGGYGQSRGQSYGNTSERGQYSNGFKLGARKTHSGRARFQEYDNEFNNSQFSRKGVGSGANRPGGSSRFGFSKYGLEKGSFALDRNFDEGAEHVERKRRSVNSESSHNDFKQILDALRDH